MYIQSIKYNYNANTVKADNKNNNHNYDYNPNFKANLGDWIGKKYAKYYAKPLYNQMWLQKLSENLAKVPGSMTEHMAALGSAITSGVYMKRTLDNKDLDKEKRQTLAVNQGLCFAIPTVLSYWANSKLASFNKKQEYLYSGKQEHKKANGLIPKEKLADFDKATGNRLKGFKTLASLMTFTLIYRYASPVIITPIANWIGDKMKSSNKAKEESLNKAKEVSIAENKPTENSQKVA